MTCDVVRTRLLALPAPARPTDDLLTHLAACAACRAVQAEATRLDAVIAALPVPSSDARKGTFLDTLAADGPVIRSIPVLPSTLAGSGAFRPVGSWLKRLDLRWVGGVAAAVAVTVGGVWYANRPKPAQPEVAVKPRQELLKKYTDHHNTLAKARTAPDRLKTYAVWSDDIQVEACSMSNAADQQEMNSLATQYERMVADGVEKQAKQVADQPMTVDDRQKVLRDAISRLTTAETEARKLEPAARTAARPALKRIADAATAGRKTLTQIAEARGAP
jgi:hypothetical protein